MGKTLRILTAVLVYQLLFSVNLVLADNSAICLECHNDKAQSMDGTAHQSFLKAHLSSPVKVECIDCHDGGEVHNEDPSPGTISRSDKMTMIEEASLCSRCHNTPHQVAMVSTDPHSKTDLNCSSCHTIHDNHTEGLVKEEMEDFCLSCHGSVMMDFERRSAHPLHAMAIECTDCHDLSATEKSGSADGFDWLCQGCHDEKAGPFIYEHAVVYDHPVDGGGCLECHEPHGSANDRLLRQPRSGTCLQCHAIPPGHLTDHSGLGVKLDCMTCHTDIHGSYESRLLLDPDLGTKLFPDCFQSGCHTLNGN